jgi:hypothetical protein
MAWEAIAHGQLVLNDIDVLDPDVTLPLALQLAPERRITGIVVGLHDHGEPVRGH